MYLVFFKDLGLVPSNEFCGSLPAVLKSHEETAELAVASWQRARAAVCLWSHGSSSSSVSNLCWKSSDVLRAELCTGLLRDSRRLRFRGISSPFAFSVPECTSLGSEGSFSLSWFLVERLRGARSSVPSAGSVVVSGHGSETDMLSSANLKKAKQKFKCLPLCCSSAKNKTLIS